MTPVQAVFNHKVVRWRRAESYGEHMEHGVVRLGLVVGLLLVGLAARPAAGATIAVDCDAGDVLQDAIDDADPGDEILLTGTCLEYVTIGKDLLITGDGQSTTIIDAAGLQSTVVVDPDVEVTIRSLTITGGDDAFGGGVDNSGTLLLEDVGVVANSAVMGAGIGNQGTGALTLLDTAVRLNAASGDGGGIHSDFGGMVTLTDTEIYGNEANGSGGGVYQADETLTITGSTVDANHSLVDGGGIWIGDMGLLAITDTSLTGNDAARNGGGVMMQDATASIESSDIVANTGDAGGGLLAVGSHLTLIDVNVDGNTSAGDGGGLMMDGLGDTDAALTVTDSSITNNDAAGEGGGIHTYSVHLTMADTQIEGNEANNGGGISTTIGIADLDRIVVSNNTTGGGDGAGYLLNATQLTLRDSTIDGNDAAGGSGGGWFITGEDTVALVERSTISSNLAGNGAGFDIQSNNVTILNSTISDNMADTEGGGFQTESASPEIFASTVTGNMAVQGGGISVSGGEGPTLSGTIVAGNSASQGVDCYSLAAGDTLGSDGYNLVGSMDGCDYDADSSDLIGVDPQLGPLTGNGGATESQQPMVGSPVIDYVPASACGSDVDQRGLVRPQGSGCDIGSVEYTDQAVSACGFTDIDGNTFEDDICWIFERGITLGCSVADPNLYCPSDSVSRGQMASFLARALGLSDGAGSDLFDDDDGSVHEDNIDLIATAGITVGCDANNAALYCPLDDVARAQMASFLARALALTDGAGSDLFTDDDGSVHEDNIDLIATVGITRGCEVTDPTLYCPRDPVSRGQMAAFIHRALDPTGAA